MASDTGNQQPQEAAQAISVDRVQELLAIAKEAAKAGDGANLTQLSSNVAALEEHIAGLRKAAPPPTPETTPASSSVQEPKTLAGKRQGMDEEEAQMWEALCEAMETDGAGKSDQPNAAVATWANTYGAKRAKMGRSG